MHDASFALSSPWQEFWRYVPVAQALAIVHEVHDPTLPESVAVSQPSTKVPGSQSLQVPPMHFPGELPPPAK